MNELRTTLRNVALFLEEKPMPHYHTESFENAWKIVRETPNSQKWRVTTADEGVEIEVDIHYTPEKVLTVNLVVAGTASKGLLTSVLDEIGRLGLYRGDYAVIDYTLAETKKLNNGNYSVNEKDREFRKL